MILARRHRPVRLRPALGGLAQDRGNDLLRVKGLVRFADRPDRPAVVQAAQHAMFTPEWLDAWPDSDPAAGSSLSCTTSRRDEILARFAFAQPSCCNNKIPAKAGTYSSTFTPADTWVPAFAGNRCKGRVRMLDTVISGGMAVLPSGAEPADIGVQGEKIAAIGAPGSLAAIGAGRVIDATGQIVIPGGIDPHVHCNWPMPLPDGEAKLT